MAATRVAVRDAAQVTGASRIVVAVSGGADSLALAAAAAYHQRQGLEVCAVVVDHGLQAGSAQVAARAASQCRSLGLAADVVAVTVVETGDGPEAAARAARYAALETAGLAVPGSVVVLGHTRDDQAEQVLLGLARGSGIRSLAGIPPQRGVFVRPFLLTGRGSDAGVTRAVTRAACQAQGLDPWEDPHNQDLRYLRARVRAALPMLADALGAEGSGLARALARTADLARVDADALDAVADQAASSFHLYEWDAADLAAMPDAVRLRVLRNLLARAGVRAGDLGAVHTAAVDDLLTSWHGQGAVQLPGGVAVARSDGHLRVSPGGC